MEFPAQFGRHTLLKALATGSGQETYLARRAGDDTPGGEYVIKRVPAAIAASDLALNAIRTQADDGAELTHPAIVTTFGYHEGDEGPYVSAAFVYGEDLRHIAERGMTVGRFMTSEMAVHVIIELSKALDYVHNMRRGRAHGDVSPGNVMIGFDGRVRLVDLGIPTPGNPDAFDALLPLIGPKLGYSSPEEVRGASMDARSDVFGLGVLLYEFTTQQRLFNASDHESTLTLVESAWVQPPSDSVASYPPELESIVLKALSASPDERYTDASALRAALEGYQESSETSVTSEALATYVRGLFEDTIEATEELLGSGYAGPDEARAARAAAGEAGDEEAEAEVEPAAEAAPTGLDETAEQTAVANAESPPPVDAVAEAKPQTRSTAGKSVTSASHELRRVKKDKFEKAADQSRASMIVLGLIMVGIALGAIWYVQNYGPPWEHLFSDPEDPPVVEPLPPRELPATVAVEITSEPAGVAVAVNGVMAPGATPLSAEMVPNTVNTVGFYLDGYETRVFDVGMGATDPMEPVHTELVQLVQPEGWVPPEPEPPAEGEVIDPTIDPNVEPEPIVWAPDRGVVRVTSDPDGADILLNGRFACRAPCDVDVLAAHEQHLTARLFDHLDTVTTTVAHAWDSPEDTRFLELTLRPTPERDRIYSSLMLESFPPFAAVEINSEPRNATPIEALLEITEAYRVELAADGFEPWARTLYPSVGRYEWRPIMTRILDGPAQYSIFVDAPDLNGVVIFLKPEGHRGARELGRDSVELHEATGGTYELTISYRPPRESGEPRRSTTLTTDLVAGQHVTERYAWNLETGEWERTERSEGELQQLEN